MLIMVIIMKKRDFFTILEKNPTVKEMFEGDYERKRAKATDEKKKIKVVIKPWKSLSPQMIVYVDNSDMVEIRVLQRNNIPADLIRSMRRVGVSCSK